MSEDSISRLHHFLYIIFYLKLQCFSLCRDRAPFVLTSDMAYVINGGERPTSRFQLFVDLCSQAYNLIRKHSNLFLNLLSLVMESLCQHTKSCVVYTYTLYKLFWQNNVVIRHCTNRKMFIDLYSTICFSSSRTYRVLTLLTHSHLCFFTDDTVRFTRVDRSTRS